MNKSEIEKREALRAFLHYRLVKEMRDRKTVSKPVKKEVLH